MIKDLMQKKKKNFNFLGKVWGRISLQLHDRERCLKHKYSKHDKYVYNNIKPFSE